MMTLEALAPVTYRWPGGEIEFTPGVPVNVPDERARRILTKAHGEDAKNPFVALLASAHAV